jgi:GNAT superfamily N-acetyltransferase
MSASDVRIARLPGDRLSECLLRQVEDIFFATSVRSFAPGPERDAFRERWLGRYLAGGTDITLLALAGRARVAGYLVGALENPAEQARFADIAYLRHDFADLCRSFPAHLHINLAAQFRGRGIGARLIAAFAAAAGAGGARGMHVVTGANERNVGFYLRCGFHERGRAAGDGRVRLFLATPLPLQQAAGAPSGH